MSTNVDADAPSSILKPDVFQILVQVQLGGLPMLRCYESGAAISAPLTFDDPGDFGLWEFHRGLEEGVVTIKNVGLHKFVVSNDGKLTVALGIPAQFRVQHSGQDEVQIKLKHKDQYWTLLGEAGSQEIGLECADGSRKQKFMKILIDS
ncbi:hypothetical protein AURDEDRAFT_160255 [Auricularia subglabra TFB-10046 SS5]|nr:hypothetical protein AURDEDRAFT_160255 [Auricularia subglabra TFB-10046 SS5]